MWTVQRQKKIFNLKKAEREASKSVLKDSSLKCKKLNPSNYQQIPLTTTTTTGPIGRIFRSDGDNNIDSHI